jgi:predicted RNA-binding Zn ribbon-like protein
VTSFVFVSARLSLDLAGTVLWRRSRPTELLTSPRSLEAWITQASVVDRPERIDSDALDRVRALRESIYRLASARVLHNAADPRAAKDIGALNDAATLRPPRLVMDEEGAGLSRLGGPDEVLSAVARDAIELFASPDMARTKECANPECTRLFVDLSRTTARRWCGMAECGNKHKAATYRRRRREATTG